MAKRTLLAGSIALTKTGRVYEYFALRLRPTEAMKSAFEKDPERVMSDFLRSKGFKVNSIRVVRSRRKKADGGTPRDIDIEGAKHIHSGPSQSGWV